jgi:type IV pilus assembly protein PilV
MMRVTGNDKGFSLLELLVALSILAVGLLAAASMQGVAVNGNSVANRVSVASALAQQVAEDLLSTSVTGTILTTTGGPFNYMLDPAHGTNDINIRGSGTFRARYTILTPAVVSGETVTGTTRVQVQVFYVTPNGTEAPASTVTTYKRVL